MGKFARGMISLSLEQMEPMSRHELVLNEMQLWLQISGVELSSL